MRHNANQEDYEPLSPEKVMLAALLQRAVRDLGRHARVEDRRDAIKWFKTPKKKLSYYTGFYFQDVAEILNLGNYQVQLIFDYINRTLNGELQTEGQTSGVGSSQLVKREGFCLCTEESAIQRRRRVERHNL